MLIARMPAHLAPDALAARIVEAITEAGATLVAAITVIEPGRVRIFAAP